MKDRQVPQPAIAEAKAQRGLTRRLGIAVFVVAVTVIAFGASALIAARDAAREIEIARGAFERLEISRTVEAAFARYLLAETARRLSGEADATESAEAAQLRGALLTLRRASESAVTRFGMEAARDDLIGATALGALFERIETESMLDRTRLAQGQGGESARVFLDLIASERDQTFRDVLLRMVRRDRNQAAAAFERLDEQGRRLALLGGAFGIAAVAAAAAFARGFRRTLARPIEGLAQAAADFGAGARDVRAPLDLPPEFAALGARFDAMATRIAGEQARLEAEVGARTNELASINDSLREIDARRRRFFSALSHEIRTPVTALLGEAQIALRGSPEDTLAARAALERIAASGGFLRRRLDDLLSLARSEDGALSLAMARCDLCEAAARAVTSAKAYAAMAEVDLSLSTPAAPVALTGDAAALEQAALALIDNAVKMSPPGGAVQVRVSKDTDRAELLVEDDGPGFEPGEAERVFEPYEQGQAGRRAGGSGLGLSVTRWIVERHGGDVAAASRSNGGGVVRFRIPL